MPQVDQRKPLSTVKTELLHVRAQVVARQPTDLRQELANRQILERPLPFFPLPVWMHASLPNNLSPNR